MSQRQWMALLVMGVASLWMLAGCGGAYVIHGKAIPGSFTSVSFVRPDDSRLQGPGLQNVEVYLYRDPNTLGRKIVAQGVTDDRGLLYMPVSAPGAGWLVEQWMIATYRPGYQSATSFVSLPDKKAGMQLLMTLGPGTAEPPPRTDEWSESYDRFK